MPSLQPYVLFLISSVSLNSFRIDAYGYNVHKALNADANSLASQLARVKSRKGRPSIEGNNIEMVTRDIISMPSQRPMVPYMVRRLAKFTRNKLHGSETQIFLLAINNLFTLLLFSSFAHVHYLDNKIINSHPAHNMHSLLIWRRRCIGIGR
jgi:hypothetical protein